MEITSSKLNLCSADKELKANPACEEFPGEVPVRYSLQPRAPWGWSRAGVRLAFPQLARFSRGSSSAPNPFKIHWTYTESWVQELSSGFDGWVDSEEVWTGCQWHSHSECRTQQDNHLPRHNAYDCFPPGPPPTCTLPSSTSGEGLLFGLHIH